MAYYNHYNYTCVVRRPLAVKMNTFLQENESRDRRCGRRKQIETQCNTKAMTNKSSLFSHSGMVADADMSKMHGKVANMIKGESQGINEHRI